MPLDSRPPAATVYRIGVDPYGKVRRCRRGHPPVLQSRPLERRSGRSVSALVRTPQELGRGTPLNTALHEQLLGKEKCPHYPGCADSASPISDALWVDAHARPVFTRRFS